MISRSAARAIIDSQLHLNELPPEHRPLAERIIVPRLLSESVSKTDLARMIFREPELKPLSQLTQAQIAKFLCCSVPIISRAQQEVQSECACSRSVGRPKLLSDAAEQRIKAWIITRCEEQDWPTLAAFKEQVLRELELENPALTPSSQYFHDLQERLIRDQFTVKLAGPLETARFDLPREDIMRHFELLQQLGVENIDPRLIINIDETGFGASASGRLKSHKVIVPVSFSGTPVYRVEEEKRFVSCLAATTAWGGLLKPGLISDRKYDSQDGDKCSYFSQCVRYVSAKAFVSREIFGHYIRNVILPYIDAVRHVLGDPDAPALIIFDGHRSHLSEGLNALLASQRVKTYLLPPHSSHLLQPLDQWIFRKMKIEFSQMRPIPGLTKISSTLERVWSAYQSCDVFWVVWSSWRQSGLEPHIRNGTCLKISPISDQVLGSATLAHAERINEASRGRVGEEARFGWLNEDEWLIDEANQCPYCCQPLRGHRDTQRD